MTELERKNAAKSFAEYWKDKGYEKGEGQKFWLSLLGDVLGVEDPKSYIEFEVPVKLNNTGKGFIDGLIDTTHVLIEQKGRDKDLLKPAKQSDGSLQNPYHQAKRYVNDLPHDRKPRWIITCNFREFFIYDMNNPHGDPEKILLSELDKEYYRLQFIVKETSTLAKKEESVSVEAGRRVGKIYDALLTQYKDPDESSLRSLNMLCVRLVFCLYAEDSGLFGSHTMFHDYLKELSVKDVRRGLIDLFRVLDTPVNERDKYIDDELGVFPYVKGGLFEDENIEIPNFTQEIVDLILEGASENFDWSDISPTIFGAVFESTLNPETRRSGGMHYTSIENIHKVIDPLFLNELRDELDSILEVKVTKTRETKLEAFREKLSKLTFLDPACGSGNFLTETFVSLRRLENEALRAKYSDQILMDEGSMAKVSINQFYGIEINDFAVSVAKTALWIADHQMFRETQTILNRENAEFLPLTTYTNIIEGNALRLDWETVVPKEKLNYIMGNPPFVGMKEQTSKQKDDLKYVIPIKKLKQLDYVAGWYFKAVNFMRGTSIESSFVSSNSITQGEQALTIWEPLFKQGIVINYAYRTFIWESEAKTKAHVHCVIIGFSFISRKEKLLYDDNYIKKCANINHYLTPADNIFIQKLSKPICNAPEMTKGAQLIDDGHFTVGSINDYQELLAKEPNIKPYIKKYINGRALLNNEEPRYVLYLENCSPKEIKQSPFISSRVKAVYEFRANNDSPSTNILKDRPSHYFQAQTPLNKSIVFSAISSGNRRYVPMDFMTEEMVLPNTIFFVDNADLYHFGILMSNVHMAWMRTICGRLKSDYRYSNTMVYNTFPWPTPTEAQKAKIEKTAQAILDARALYPDSSLADLYDELTMPPELRKAHQLNEKAVMEAYGFWGKLNSESECVAELMKMYQELIR